MDITVSVVSAAKQAALAKALQVYNASNQPISQPEFLQRLLDGQLDGLVAAYLVTKLTKLEYQSRFTSAERIKIRTAAKTDPVVEDILALMDSAAEIDLTDPRTIQGANALEALGHLNPGRAAEILAL